MKPRPGKSALHAGAVNNDGSVRGGGVLENGGGLAKDSFSLTDVLDGLPKIEEAEAGAVVGDASYFDDINERAASLRSGRSDSITHGRITVEPGGFCLQNDTGAHTYAR